MRDLPRSIFSTPGAKALVCDGTVPRAVGKEYEMYRGLKIVRVVRTAVNQRISFPCFGDRPKHAREQPLATREVETRARAAFGDA